MARKRNQKDAWIPPYVNRGKSAWEFRPKGGKTIRLCGLDASKSLVLRRHAEEYERVNTKSGTFAALVDRYLDSDKYKGLSKHTQKDYLKYWKKIKPVFGHVDVRKIEPKHIRKYMDAKGRTSITQANRHHSFMSAVFKWGFQRGDADTNPCSGVEKFSEQHRERYIEDWEYNLVYSYAGPTVRAAMEISYICAARQGDVLKLTKADLRKDGVFICQGKTGKRQIKKWGPRLRAAVTMVKPHKRKDGSVIDSIYVIPTRNGSAYTDSGFRTMFYKVQKKAREETGHPLDFTFHDIKAKSISDFEGDKQKLSGHKTAKQVEIYDRKLKPGPTIENNE